LLEIDRGGAKILTGGPGLPRPPSSYWPGRKPRRWVPSIRNTRRGIMQVHWRIFCCGV